MLTLKSSVLALATLALVLVSLPPIPAYAMGASVSAPLRHEIDAQCDPLDRAAQTSTLIFGIHVTAFKGEDASGTFAHVLAHHGRIVAVYFYSTETQTRGETVTRDCYLAGHLARMRSEYQLRSGQLWTRTKYFGDDGAFMTQTDQHRPSVAGSDAPAGPPPADEPVYRTPAALPFYAAFNTARKH